ncbi:hypothetical protein [Pseudoalteromonas rubra]|uniref:hypothetical protein n=1 Tax=Pseudoalteromonas rubra TaxID=43658 RepID=UPI0013DE3839|nr:hypothetical protein [Pseudoalteromonas rubra]
MATYKKWHALDQASLSALKHSAMASNSTDEAINAFTTALRARFDSHSATGKAMLPNTYLTDTTSVPFILPSQIRQP